MPNGATVHRTSAHCKKDKKHRDGLVAASGFVDSVCYDYTFNGFADHIFRWTARSPQSTGLDLSGWGRDRAISLNMGQDGIINKLHASVVDRRAEFLKTS